MIKVFMIKVFLDSSNFEDIQVFQDQVSGFTTNPSLMRKSGVSHYEVFCNELLRMTNKPVSFEVFADEFDEMQRQAEIIASWGDNVYVKIPVMNTKGKSSIQLVNKLLASGVKVNITAVMSENQLSGLGETRTPHIISVFAGRIADTGRDPTTVIFDVKNRTYASGEVLWASTREVYNIYQAETEGADIITVTPEILKKYHSWKGKDLFQCSLETVKQFYDDGKDFVL